MSNLITEIYDKQLVVDNLNQLGELINSTLNAIVANAPKLQSPIEYLTAVQSISEIEKKNTEVTQAKAKALSDLDKAYQQADKAKQQSINLEDAEFQAQTKLSAQYKEKAKEQKQLLELERVRQQTIQNANQLLSKQAQTEGELRMQQQQLIKAQQSLRVTNEQENALRTQIIQKINANKEALKGMSDEVSKQRDNVGNYKSVWDAFTQGQVNLKQAMKLVRDEMGTLEGQMAAGNKLTAEQQKRYNDLNVAMGNLTDIQGDMSARAKILSDDYQQMTFAMEGVKLGVNIMTSLQAATALLGNENEELARTMSKIVATQQILSTLTEIQKALNKDSVLRTMLRVKAQSALNKELAKTTVAEGAGTVATGAFATAEGVATTASGALTKGIKSVGVAIKSIPVVGWILAAVAALATLITLIVKANNEESEGAQIQKMKEDSLREQKRHILEATKSVEEQSLKLKYNAQKLKECEENSDEWNYYAEQVSNELGISKVWLEKNKERVDDLVDAWSKLKTAQATADAAAQKIAENNIRKQEILFELHEIHNMKYEDRLDKLKEMSLFTTQEVEALNQAMHNSNYAYKEGNRTLYDTDAIFRLMAEHAKEKLDAQNKTYEKILDDQQEIITNNNQIIDDAQTEAQALQEIEDARNKNRTAHAKALSTYTGAALKVNSILEHLSFLQMMNEDATESLTDATQDLNDVMTVEASEIAKVEAATARLVDETETLNNRMKSALLAISYEYTKALNDVMTAEEKSRIEKEKTRKEIEVQIAYSQRMLETLQPQTDEWYKVATALEQYKSKLQELNQMEPEWLKKLKSEVEEAGKAIQSLSDMNNIFAQDDLDRLTAEKDAYTLNYEERKQTIENTILDEEEKQSALKRLDNDKLIHDREFARQEAEIKRRQAIFQNAVDAAAAMSKAIAAVGELMSASAFSLPTFITAVATGVSAIATISSLIKKMIEIPAYATGGTAEANKPFIAGEKGHEIGFGMHSGKVYDFSKPTLFKANEPINIKNARETQQIINNNEYNKDVTLHNEISVQVIDNTRINKFFKIW